MVLARENASMPFRSSEPLGIADIHRASSPSQTQRGSGSARVRFPESDHVNTSFVKGTFDFLNFVVTTAIASWCVGGLMTILAILYVTVRPFSQTVYRRMVAQLAVASFLDAMALILPNTRICLTADSDIPCSVGTAVIVSNHVIDTDWWAVMMLGRCLGLKGSLKVFLRNEYLNINMHTNAETSNSVLRPSSALVSSNSSTRLISSSVRSDQDSSSPRSNEGSPSLTTNNFSPRRYASQDVSVLARLLHLLVEFPLINGEEFQSDREILFQHLRTFAGGDEAATTHNPVQFLLYPEGWSLHTGVDRLSIHAKSNEFATREGRPQLQHLLLPRNRGFKATLECLRESSPSVYDVTMAYNGYDGSLPQSPNLTMSSIWEILRCRFPKEIHFRVKRYSMGEVLQDSAWLDKKWAEKDKLLGHFARNQYFPIDNRGSKGRSRVFETRYVAIETSTVALCRLVLVPCAVPLLLILSIPVFWTVLWIWLFFKAFRMVFPDSTSVNNEPRSGSVGSAGLTPGSNSASGTPFCPATPFVSPSITVWGGLLPKHDQKED